MRKCVVAIVIFIFKILEKYIPFFFSLKTRKIRFNIKWLNKFYSIYPSIGYEFGILMQGPVIIENDFTFNTLKLYRHKYPNANILLSTWKGENNDILVKLRNIGIIVIENSKPSNFGIVNVNLQIVSTAIGILEMKKLNVQYLIKVRTDQRIYKNIDFLSLMKNLQDTFPITDNVLKSRLIIASVNTFRTRLYGITDMLMFGHIDDMEKYWCIPLEGNVNKLNRFPDPSIYIKNQVGEGYLINHFFKTTGFEPMWSTNNSLKFIVSYFCIIDKEQLDLYWLKYNRFFESIDFTNSNDYLNWERFEFSDWLNSLVMFDKSSRC